MVPRWRPWRVTGTLGELAVPTSRSELEPTNVIPALFNNLERNQSVGRKAEILSVATSIKEMSNEVENLAEEIVSGKDYRSSLLKELAQNILDGESTGKAFHVEAIDSRKRIARLKEVLGREPRNAVRWTDLAREYVSLGQLAKAEKAINVSLALAPDDRFILRSASVYYVQVGDLEHAVDLLGAAAPLTSDPWLLAPFIGISHLGGIKIRRHREAVRMLQSGDFSDRHLAELSAAIGTLEVYSGSGRRGRQYLRQSLQKPTENSLAQVEWVTWNTQERPSEFIVPIDVPRPFEAQTLRAEHDHRWPDAVQNARCWLEDQPFSLDAAVCGSFYACEAEDWQAAEEFAERGLRANPEDPTLLNNLAFALIGARNLEGAARALQHARPVGLSSLDRAYLAATEGLLFFRNGLSELGRTRYHEAIEIFSRSKKFDEVAKAALMLAREELIVSNGQLANAALSVAGRALESSSRSDIKDLHRRLSEEGFVLPLDQLIQDAAPMELLEPLIAPASSITQ